MSLGENLAMTGTPETCPALDRGMEASSDHLGPPLALGLSGLLTAGMTAGMQREPHAQRAECDQLVSKEVDDAGVVWIEPRCHEHSARDATDDFRARLLDFYGRTLGWQRWKRCDAQIASPLQSGRLRTSTSTSRPRAWCPMATSTFGVFLPLADDLQQLWDDLASDEDEVQLEPLEPNESGGTSVPVPAPHGSGSAVLRPPALKRHNCRKWSRSWSRTALYWQAVAVTTTWFSTGSAPDSRPAADGSARSGMF